MSRWERFELWLDGAVVLAVFCTPFAVIAGCFAWGALTLLQR